MNIFFWSLLITCISEVGHMDNLPFESIWWGWINPAFSMTVGDECPQHLLRVVKMLFRTPWRGGLWLAPTALMWGALMTYITLIGYIDRLLIRVHYVLPWDCEWAGVRLNMGVWLACAWVFGSLERGPQRWSKNRSVGSHLGTAMIPDMAIKIYSSSVLDMAKWNLSGVIGVKA